MPKPPSSGDRVTSAAQFSPEGRRGRERRGSWDGGKTGCDQPAEGLGAMADLMFALGIHLTKGLAAAIGQEHGIIAEPLVAPGRPDEAAMDLTLEGIDMAIGPGERKHRDEMCLAIGF